MTEPTWILYVSHDTRHAGTTSTRPFCAGSTACMRSVRDFDLGDTIAIQDCDVMRRGNAQLPAFLKGTPTLVHREEWTTFTGSQALAQINTIAAEVLDGRAAAAATTQRPPQRAPPPVAPSRDPSSSSGGGRPLRDSVALGPPSKTAPAAPVARPSAPSMPAEDPDVLGGDFSNLVDNPPPDDLIDQPKITEEDVKRLMDERNRSAAVTAA